MLQYQVSDQLSTLTLKDKDCKIYPLYLHNRDFNVGLSNFWKSPYGRGNIRKRELPTVTPSTYLADSKVAVLRPNDVKIKGILKKGHPVVDMGSDESNSGLNRKRLRRTYSISCNTNIYQTSKKVQFDEINQNNKTQFNGNVTEIENRTESQCVNRISSELGGTQITASSPKTPSHSTRFAIRSPRIPRPVSVLGVIDYDAQSCKQSGVPETTVPPKVRIARLCRSNTVSTISAPQVAAEHVSNFNKLYVRPPRRPNTCFDTRSAIIPDHRNYCTREKTIRIIKWLEEVYATQTRDASAHNLHVDDLN